MKSGSDTIRCPCLNCNNSRFKSISQVEDHLYSYGMVKDYIKWTKHGEEESDDEIENDDIIEKDDAEDDEEDVDDVVEMLHEYQAGAFADNGVS